MFPRKKKSRVNLAQTGPRLVWTLHCPLETQDFFDLLRQEVWRSQPCLGVYLPFGCYYLSQLDYLPLGQQSGHPLGQQSDHPQGLTYHPLGQIYRPWGQSDRLQGQIYRPWEQSDHFQLVQGRCSVQEVHLVVFDLVVHLPCHPVNSKSK